MKASIILPKPKPVCGTIYLYEHDVVVEGFVVVVIMNEDSGDVELLFKSLRDIKIMLAQNHFHQKTPLKYESKSVSVSFLCFYVKMLF